MRVVSGQFGRLVVEELVELEQRKSDIRMHILPHRHFDRHVHLDCAVGIRFDKFVGMGIVVAEHIVKCIVVDIIVGNWQVAVVVLVLVGGVLVSSSPRRFGVVETGSCSWQ